MPKQALTAAHSVNASINMSQMNAPSVTSGADRSPIRMRNVEDYSAVLQRLTGQAKDGASQRKRRPVSSISQVPSHSLHAKSKQS